MEKNLNYFVSKKYIVFLLFFYYFLLRDPIEQFIPVFKYVDEMVAASAIPIYFFRHIGVRKNKRDYYNLFILLFFCIGILSSIVHKYQPLSVVAADAFLCLKFWLAIYVGKFFLKGFDIKKYATKIYFHVRLIVWIYTILLVLNVIAILRGGAIFASPARYGWYSTQLFYEHPSDFVASCVLILMILTSIKKYISGSFLYFFWLLVLMCTSLRSKAFGAAAVFLILWYFVFVRKKKIKLGKVLVFLPIVIFIAWNQINFYFFNEQAGEMARARFLSGAVEVATDHFPLGSGFATFASYLSGVYYSPLYRLYHMDQIYGLVKGSVTYASDTFWPMVLGQTGFIGLIAYVIAVILLFKKIQLLKNFNNDFYMSALCGFSYTIISSVAESAFVHPLFIPIAMWLGFMFSKVD